MDFISYLQGEAAVIGNAPIAFIVCVGIVGTAIYIFLKQLKSQEITNLNGILALREAEIADYRRKLDVRTPEEAQAQLESAQVTAAVESEDQPSEQTAPAPPTIRQAAPRTSRRKPPEAEPEKSRTYIAESDYLEAARATKGMTHLQASESLSGFLGRWVRLSGPLFDVRKSSSGLLLFLRVNGKITGCRFSAEWADRLNQLRAGDPVVVAGRIRSLSSGVMLEHCELVDQSDN